ncbi:DUF1707 SHOCT-like domain-containing protein [Streptomyces johnsoniae]|uniref:DUF1707 domain-containing protein n=1 Tax=Streptomyces johnsoniae TaxID=3075532 RepID=A0ABU2S3U1_9ACTN|nr:DUF1707 domain-containing protein [Streptomyces sp. DSM 41886]MDT0443648.1 DUF1707 domain-containing protein [Streptomyces sp. DSM 41886]
MTSEPRPHAKLRASYEDREAVAERLREAAGEGRLDLEELEERLEKALTAKTYGDLEPLIADLPAQPGLARSLGSAPPAPDGRPLVLKGGIHGANQVGRWQVPPKVIARGGLGGVKVDYSRADCAWPETEIEVHGDMAGITIIVPPGWEVDTSGADPGFGGIKNKTTGERLRGAPVLRLTGTGGVAGVTVRHPNRWERRRLRDNPA